MSYAFDARFSPTPLDLRELLALLEQCLEESSIDFAGEIVRLHSRGGVPKFNTHTLTTESASSLHDVVRIAKQWWGVSLYCLSRPLANALGRSDAIEIDLYTFRIGNGRILVYNEAYGPSVHAPNRRT